MCVCVGGACEGGEGWGKGLVLLCYQGKSTSGVQF